MDGKYGCPSRSLDNAGAAGAQFSKVDVGFRRDDGKGARGHALRGHGPCAETSTAEYVYVHDREIAPSAAPRNPPRNDEGRARLNSLPLHGCS